MKKISSLEYNALIWFLLRACFTELTFTVLINNIKQDSWISIIIGSIIGIIPFTIFEILKKNHPNDNLITLNKKTYKKYGNIINIILLIGCLIAIRIDKSILCSSPRTSRTSGPFASRQNPGKTTFMRQTLKQAAARRPSAYRISSARA